MPTRYQRLRESVAHLAASPEEQVAYLNSILGHLTPDGDAAGYGNDELGMEFGDIFLASPDMIECGELTDAERAAILPLDSVLEKWSGQENADFWVRPALFSDPRWQVIRDLASAALAQLPDEKRAVGWSA
ncbi:MAG: hypothetical protein CL803_08495 [Citromicrobium sp.]|nr:hypothetical protein [Citromicrobium sp.]MBT47022.1 hypothetical protein [Citromicrobium sp.]